MTQTLDTSTTPRAAIVTESTWDLVTNRAEIARARTNPPAPIVRTMTSRTAHADPGCIRAKGLAVVATDVALDTAEAGLPCDWCIPNLRGEVVVTPAEVAADKAAADARAEWERKTSGTGTGSGGAPRVNGPSEAQERFLRSLWTDLFTARGEADPAAAVEAQVARCRERGSWTRKNASNLIDDAKADLLAHRELAKAGRIDTAPVRDVPAGLQIMDRPNRYAGACYLCGGNVAEGAGRLAKNGGWTVVHNDGECGAPSATPSTPSTLPDVPAGHYAIPSSGDNDLAFYRVDRPTEGDYAGRVFVKLVVGGHPDQRVAARNVAGILGRIAEHGIEASARLYGQEIGRCCRCNRHLTDEESRRLGIGPECRTKVGF